MVSTTSKFAERILTTNSAEMPADARRADIADSRPTWHRKDHHDLPLDGPFTSATGYQNTFVCAVKPCG
jgi:hypothetical protein